jgi:O-antigen/teichoic acid export membrane protein
VIAILVPPRHFGVIAVGTVIVSVSTLLISSGTGGSLIIARTLDAGSVRRSVVRTAAVGVAGSLILVAAATPIAHRFAKGSDPAALRGLAPVIALSAVCIVPNALLMKYLEFKRIAVVNVVATLVGSTAAITAAALGAGVWSLVVRLLLYQALLAGLSWVAAARLFPRSRPEDIAPARREGARSFLLIAIAGFIAWDGDTLVVGASTNTTQVGLYAFAFSLAYLPLSQISWTIGSVLLPAVASARDPEVVRRQALKALRLMALLLLPLLPVAVVLARGAVPTLLGHEWSGIVVPFQILVVAGIGQGMVNTLGEVFAGAGGESLRRRGRVDAVWAVGTVAAIAVGVQLDGIRGAAAVHVLTVCCVASVYALWIGHTVGLGGRALAAELRGVGACVLAQALATAGLTLAARAAGAGWLAAGVAGAFAGGVVLALTLRLWAPVLLSEGRDVLRAVMRRGDAVAA